MVGFFLRSDIPNDMEGGIDMGVIRAVYEASVREQSAARRAHIKARRQEEGGVLQ